MEQNNQLMTVADMKDVAADIAKSGLFAMERPEQIFALMMVCQSEGLHPIQALKRYHIIEGRPSMRADAMQAEFQRQGGTLEWVESSSEACEAIFSHPCMPTPFRLRVTLKDYVDSGVAMGWDRQANKQVLKKNWKQFPSAMLRARVISSGVRAVLPGVVAGIYTPEEVQDFENPAATTSAPPVATAPKAAPVQKAPPVSTRQKDAPPPAATKPAAPKSEAEEADQVAAEILGHTTDVVEGEFTPVEEASPAAGDLAQREQTATEIDPARVAAIEALPETAPATFGEQSIVVKAIKKLLDKESADALSVDCKALTSDTARQAKIQHVLNELRSELGGF